MSDLEISSKQLAVLRVISAGNDAGVETFPSRDLMSCGNWHTKGGPVAAIDTLVRKGWLHVIGPRRMGVSMRVRLIRPISEAIIVEYHRTERLASSAEDRRLRDPTLADRAVAMHVGDGMGLRAIADALGLHVGGAAKVRELLSSKGVVARSRNEQKEVGMRRHQLTGLSWPKIDKKAGMPPFNIYQDVAVDREAGTFARISPDMAYSPTGNAGAMCAGN